MEREQTVLVSENVSKKRGRPRKYSDALLAVCSPGPEVQSIRGRQNWIHQATAIKALGPDGEFAWIWPSHEAIMAGRANGRRTILQHLGRLHPDDIRIAAKYICDHQLKTAASIDYIRRFTGRKAKPSSGIDLFKVLANALDSYHETHEWNYQVIHSAITGLLETVSEMDGEQ